LIVTGLIISGDFALPFFSSRLLSVNREKNDSRFPSGARPFEERHVNDW
jgi:hypothetical protein